MHDSFIIDIRSTLELYGAMERVPIEDKNLEIPIKDNLAEQTLRLLYKVLEDSRQCFSNSCFPNKANIVFLLNILQSNRK